MTFRMFGGLDVADGFVKVRVERMSDVRGNFPEPKIDQGTAKLIVNLGDPFEKGGILRSVLVRGIDRAFKVVEHR
jgi:hypothetical protein